MTNLVFKELLDQVNITWRYDHVENGTKLPYGVYTFERESLLNADNKIYAIKHAVGVDVYAKSKTSLDSICEQLEEIFANNEIVWSSTETYSLDESFYLNSYSLEV